MVTNVGATLVLNDTFTLIGSPIGSGAFTSVVLPVLPNGLGWQDNTAVDGTIKVVVGSVPPSIVTDLAGVTNYAYVGANAILCDYGSRRRHAPLPVEEERHHARRHGQPDPDTHFGCPRLASGDYSVTGNQ